VNGNFITQSAGAFTVAGCAGSLMHGWTPELRKLLSTGDLYGILVCPVTIYAYDLLRVPKKSWAEPCALSTQRVVVVMHVLRPTVMSAFFGAERKTVSRVGQ
jgi:hypothetical protein